MDPQQQSLANNPVNSSNWLGMHLHQDFQPPRAKQRLEQSTLNHSRPSSHNINRLPPFAVFAGHEPQSFTLGQEYLTFNRSFDEHIQQQSGPVHHYDTNTTSHGVESNTGSMLNPNEGYSGASGGETLYSHDGRNGLTSIREGWNNRGEYNICHHILGSNDDIAATPEDANPTTEEISEGKNVEFRIESNYDIAVTSNPTPEERSEETNVEVRIEESPTKRRTYRKREPQPQHSGDGGKKPINQKSWEAREKKKKQDLATIEECEILIKRNDDLKDWYNSLDEAYSKYKRYETSLNEFKFDLALDLLQNI